MKGIAKCATVEDRYIANLAGQKNGKETIGFLDKYRVWAAKPIFGNGVAAAVLGTIGGISFTTVGTLVSPFFDNSTRPYILENPLGFCVACGTNARKIVDLGTSWGLNDPKMSSIEAMAAAVTTCTVEKITTKLDDASKTLYDLGIYLGNTIGMQTKMLFETQNPNLSDASATIDVIKACRLFNYTGAVIDTVTARYLELTAGTIAVSIALIYLSKKLYDNSQKKNEAAVATTLTTRYGQIANRLQSSAPTQEMQLLARQILGRRVDINQKIEKLGLPLSWKEIENITNPVFTAAQEMLGKKAFSKTA